MFEVPENCYLEERRLHKLTQYGESEPEEKANENVLGRYKAIAGNLVNEIRQEFFFGPVSFSSIQNCFHSFAESLQVSNLHRSPY